MGTGYYHGFGKTRGSIAFGDAVFRTNPTQFFSNIEKRKEIDRGGMFEVVAHGSAFIIEVLHQGVQIPINARILAKLIKSRKDYRFGQGIRLLACNTGSIKQGIAQNLANKLNVIVEAPTSLVWAYSDGRYIVADRRSDEPGLPDLAKRGKFVKFYPGGKRK